MMEANSCTTPMTTGSKLFPMDSELFLDPSLYKSIVGALQYLTLTRPDLSFTMNKLSQFLQSLTDLHWQACKKVLRCIQGIKDYGLKFTPTASLEIECYADADWDNNIEDRRSTNGYCVYLGPNLIQWSSRKQKVVSLSSTEVSTELWHIQPLKLPANNLQLFEEAKMQ
ncbi:secreted RxLR effector protein 161-like [Pistacia vera]|uniref:secreted RxLR effector protein 161-like n=1 Tax=Pistacia vera TaxID=55513 RepID=UPI001262B5C8|nr:secreted RxLR effector protein 161-like [Pistacia vera]